MRYSIFTKITTFEVYFKSRRRTSRENATVHRVRQFIKNSKMNRNLFIGYSFVKIIAVEFGAIVKAEF